MAKDWPSLQEEIRQLYCVDKKPLREVMRIVKGRHGFQASLRSYRTQIQKWGYTKYISRSHHGLPDYSRNIQSENQPHLGGDGGHSAIEGMQTKGGLIVPVSTRSSRGAGYHVPFEQRQDGSNNNNYYDIHASSTYYPTYSGAPGLRPEGEIHPGLFRAVRRGDLETARRRLHSGVPVNNLDQSGNSLLYYAVRDSMPEIAIELIRFGADVQAKDAIGRPLLHLAIGGVLLNLAPDAGNKKIIDALLLGGADPSAQNAHGDTILHVVMYAISRCEDDRWPDNVPSAVDALLSRSTDLNIANNDGLTPFDMLMDKKRYCYDTFRYLDRFFSANTHAVTLTTRQIQNFVKFLRRASEHRTWSGECGYYCESVICHFIRQGADPHTTLPSGEMLSRRFLRQADQNCGVVVAELCKVLDPHMSWEDGNTILHELCSPNDGRPVGRSRIVSSMKTALEAGASPNSRNKRGETPLLLIFLAKDRAKGFIHVVDLLLESGADPFLQDTAGNCPLVLAGRVKVSLSPGQA